VKQLLLRIEPLIWLLFGAGILLGTLLLPAYLLTVTLAAPLGMLPSDALSFERAHALATHPLGRLVLLGLIALPLWKGAHHMRSFALDLLGARWDVLVAPVLYGLGVVGSVLALAAVLQIPAG
jgi:fumarate reductase subunit D